MSNIVGIESIEFKTKDGETITGSRIHMTEDIPAGRGMGKTVDSFFLSTARLAQLDFMPAVGQNIEVLYSKFGKLKTVRLVDDLIDLG